MPHLRQIVGTHQPDEAKLRKPLLQLSQRIGGKARCKPRFEIGRLDPRMVRGQGSGRGETVGQGGHALYRLQRVLGRDEPPDLVEIEGAQRLETDMEVAAMRRVEGAADKADAPPRPPGEAGGQMKKAARARLVVASLPGARSPLAQGRT